MHSLTTRRGLGFAAAMTLAAGAPIADRVIRLHDAQIQSITVNDQPQHIGDLEY